MAATQSHFRFYADGTESGAIAHAAEDANPTCGPTGTIPLDTIFHLRICLQNDASVANNVAPQFTYALNGGGYTNITTSSTVVRATASANLTEGANTTQRLSGTGSFETSSAGVTEDGLAGGTAMDLVASGNAETVCSLVVRSADVAHGDVITFRVSGTGISAWTATPTLTVSIPPLDPVTLTETLHLDDYGEIQVHGRIRSTETIVDRTLTTAGGLTREVPAETLHISDAVTPRMTLGPVTLAETLHISDPVTARMTLGDVARAETLHIADVVTARITLGEVTLAETLHISDPATLRMTLGDVALTETLHLSDTATPLMGGLAVEVAEALHLSDVATVSLTPLQVTAAETLHVSDPVSPLMGGLTATLAETLHLSDAVTPAMQGPAILTASLSEQVYAADGVGSYTSMGSIETVHVVDTDLTAELSGATNPSVTRSETLHIADTVTASRQEVGGLYAAPLSETLHLDDYGEIQVLGRLRARDLAVLSGDALFATVSETVFVFDWGFVSVANIEAVHVLDTDLTVELSTPGQLTRALTETLHLTDTLTVLRVPLEAVLAETLHVADTIVDRQVVGGLFREVSAETLHLADATDGSWAGLDDPEVLHIADTIVDVALSGGEPLSPAILTETLHVTDTVTARMTLGTVTVSETLHVGETVTPLMGGLTTGTLTETLHVADTVTASLTPLVVTLGETLHLTETVTIVETPLEAVAVETLHLSDAIFNRFLSSEGTLDPVLLTESLHLSDTATAVLDPLQASAAETLHLADSVTPRITLGDVTFAETLHVSESVVGAALAAEGTLSTAVEETLHVTDSVTALLPVLFVVAAETLHVSETVATGLELAVVRTETLHLTDGPAVPQQVGQPLNVSLTETVTVTEAPTAAVNPLQAVLSETLHVVDAVDIYVAGTLLVTLTETLHVADTVYPERPPVIIGVGIYDFTIRGVGIYDPEA